MVVIVRAVMSVMVARVVVSMVTVLVLVLVVWCLMGGSGSGGSRVFQLRQVVD